MNAPIAAILISVLGVSLMQLLSTTQVTRSEIYLKPHDFYLVIRESAGKTVLKLYQLTRMSI
jgi:hypothetical protein